MSEPNRMEILRQLIAVLSAGAHLAARPSAPTRFVPVNWHKANMCIKNLTQSIAES
jgi:hypothetical protein